MKVMMMRKFYFPDAMMSKNRHISCAAPDYEGGFTLIELLIAVSIIGILAAIAVPLYVGQQKKAAFSEAQTNLQNLRLLQEQVFADTGLYAPNSLVVTATYNSTNDLVANPDCSLPLNATKAAKILCGLPRFRPGNARDLKYDYVIHTPAQLLVSGTCNSNGNDPNAPAAAAAGQSFTACARPKAGTIVAGTAPFWINDRNQSNIQ